MLLYLIRHAIAEERAKSGRDAERALTAEGREKMERAAAGLRALDVKLDRILTSPLCRARETAEIVAAALGGVELEEIPALASGEDPSHVLASLRRQREAERLALVGHQPDLGYLASLLLTGSPDICPLPFKKGGVACVETEGPRGLRGTLLWFVTPGQLRGIAK